MYLVRIAFSHLHEAWRIFGEADVESGLHCTQHPVLDVACQLSNCNRFHSRFPCDTYRRQFQWQHFATATNLLARVSEPFSQAFHCLTHEYSTHHENAGHCYPMYRQCAQLCFFLQKCKLDSQSSILLYRRHDNLAFAVKAYIQDCLVHSLFYSANIIRMTEKLNLTLFAKSAVMHASWMLRPTWYVWATL